MDTTERGIIRATTAARYVLEWFKQSKVTNGEAMTTVAVMLGQMLHDCPDTKRALTELVGSVLNLSEAIGKKVAEGNEAYKKVALSDNEPQTVENNTTVIFENGAFSIRSAK